VRRPHVTEALTLAAWIAALLRDRPPRHLHHLIRRPA